MKLRLFIFLNLALLMTGFKFLQAQNKSSEYFEGSVQYKIDYEGKAAKVYQQDNPPSKMDLHISRDDYIINLYEARIPRTFLFIGDSNHTFIVDMAKKQYFLRDYFQGDSVETPPIAKKVKDSVQVGDYLCEVYRVVKPDQIVYYYVSDEVRVDLRQFHGKDDARADFMIRGLEGRIPLKKVIQRKYMTISTEYYKIREGRHPEENFRIPPGFYRRIRDPRK